jgi:hypothetical protein
VLRSQIGFATLEDLKINSAWEMIRENIKITAKERKSISHSSTKDDQNY